MKNKTQRIVKVTTSEIEIVTRHCTYEVAVDESQADKFIEKMDGLCGHRELYQELGKHDYRFLSKEDGKKYPTDDNFSSSVDSVELTSQLAFSL